MALEPPNEHVIKLIESFGLDAKHMGAFHLSLIPGKVVTIKAEFYPDEQDIKNGAKVTETFMKEYHIVENQAGK